MKDNFAPERFDTNKNVEEWSWEGEGPFRVSCGGHWASYPGSVTVSARLNREANDRNHTQGFRLVRKWQ